MKKFIYLLVALILTACAKTESEIVVYGSISGSVSDMTTGEPVPTVNVQLVKLIKVDYDEDYYYDEKDKDYYSDDYEDEYNDYTHVKSTVTGSDGSFHFENIPTGDYGILINKEGYEENGMIIAVNNNEVTPAHMLIERIPAIVTADRSVLDFGSDKSLNTLSFNIVNRSYEDLSWSIVENCEWITEIKETSGVLKYGKTETIIVIIDREKLESGDNHANIVVRSNNGSTEVEIRATGEYKALPILEIYDATNVRAYTATLNAEITSDGAPAYSERGFVYGTTPLPTIDNCTAKVSSPKNSTATFSFDLKQLTYKETYYARAYAINSLGVAYSPYDITFTTAAVPATVTTQAITDINYEKGSATLHGTIVSVGEPGYTERGFVYGTSPKPTIDDNKITKSGTGTGAYSLYVTNLPTDVTFYVRAYAINDAGVAYGEDVSVSSEYITLQAAKLMVQNKDLGEVNWNSAKSMCESSIVGGYTDWRLPTKDELMILYNNRDKIGGFKTSDIGSYYWASKISGYYYYIDFYDGTIYNSYKSSYALSVRAVRSIE